MTASMIKPAQARDFPLWENWRNADVAERWRGALRTIEVSLRHYADERGIALELTERRWEAADVQAMWSAGNARRSVQVTVESADWPLRCLVRGAAWQDTYLPNHRLHRVWSDTQWEAFDVADLAALNARLEAAWPEVFSRIEGIVPDRVV